ncbi:hypothetical protein JZU54_02590 [bacterium]|nr:hypothetical protein [bacterium]
MAGTYSATGGASACAACPNSSSSAPGSTSIASCACNAGMYQNEVCINTISTLQRSCGTSTRVLHLSLPFIHKTIILGPITLLMEIWQPIPTPMKKVHLGGVFSLINPF